MKNKHENLNTEENDIAGNRIDGPVGNTAAKPGRPGTGTGIPGGAPTASRDDDDFTTPPSSEALVASEMSVGQGAVEPAEFQENKEADPADLTPSGPKDGAIGTSPQARHHDQAQRDNEASDANRGEFGVQDPGVGGTTHGGFGNQNRRADYEPHGSAEDKYYGGPGRSGPQENAYRAYDGRDERPDSRTEYGFERGTAPAPEAAPIGSAAHAPANDNGAPIGPDPGYAADYGHTSLRPNEDRALQNNAPPGLGRRNQTDDYLPAQAGYDNQGRHNEQQHPVARQGHEESSEAAQSHNARTGDARSGYVQAPDGNTDQGIGSRGGSYNDAYDDSAPGSTAGSPAKGDEHREDRDQNYGETARRENRANEAENEADHGAPQRNAGRDE